MACPQSIFGADVPTRVDGAERTGPVIGRELSCRGASPQPVYRDPKSGQSILTRYDDVWKAMLNVAALDGARNNVRTICH
jgi:hypothetical protein